MISNTRRRGVALVIILITLAVFVVLAGAFAVMLGQLSDRTSKVVRVARARAVAEAGVESALARPESREPGILDIGGGQCRYSVAIIQGQPDRIRILSDGRINAGRNCVVVEIELILRKPASPGGTFAVVSRQEHTRMERAGK